MNSSGNSISSNERKYSSPNPLKRVLLRRFLSELFTTIERDDPAVMLDVGCGEGFIAQNLLGRNPNLSYTGVDLSEEAVSKAQERNAGGTFLAGSASQLPFEDNRFDTAICIETLEHLENPGSAVREICRVTRKTIIFSVPHEPWFRLGNLAGLSHLSTFGNPPDHLNHWNAATFKKFLDPFVSITGIVTPFPWMIFTVEPSPEA